MIRVFDGHNDTLMALTTAPEHEARSFFDAGVDGHLDLPRARRGGFGGGFFAMYTPADPGVEDSQETLTIDGVDIQMAIAIAPEYAWRTTQTMLAKARQLVDESQGAVAIVESAAEIEDCFARGTLAILLHIEGCECIDRGGDDDFAALDELYDAGLRSLGIVWSRPNVFGFGVPFRNPQSPNIGPGLSDRGKALVRRAGERGIVVDCSHLNERGFWDVAEHSPHPLVATHCGAWSITPSARNLNDAQLDAIAERFGVVGVNFYVGDLRRDGQSDPETPLTTLIETIDYVVDRIGIEHVAFGSDFDGATMSNELVDVTGLPRLIAGLAARGYDESALSALAHGNWLRVLRTILG